MEPQRHPVRPIGKALGMLIVLVLAYSAASQAQIRKTAGPHTTSLATPSKTRVHIPQGKAVSLTHTMTDGGGYIWDIQHYGRIGRGTNRAYGSGMYCQVNGNTVPSGSQAWANKDGDEIEVGPQSYMNLNISRRIKVYRDQPLARWLDIFENTTSSDVSVQVRIYSSFNYQLQGVRTNSGSANFGEEDWAFITELQQRGQNSPSLAHIVCGPKSKLRPTVRLQHNQLYVEYSLTVPAGQTRILCYFESQNRSTAEHRKLMKSFRAWRALRDLSSDVRKVIANFNATGGFADLELDRAEAHDTLIRTNGDPLYGTITTPRYDVETFYGTLSLPADQVVGMVANAAEPGKVRLALTDGQIVAGKLAQATIGLKLPTGGELQVPVSHVSQCSYRINKARPNDFAFSGPLLLLRTGERLRYDGSGLELKLRTRNGTVLISPEQLLHVTMDNAGNAVHQALFVNGSNLAGLLEPERIDVPLALGPRLVVHRDLVSMFVFAVEDKPDGTLTQISLTNGGELHGRMTDASLSLKTAYGTVALRPNNIMAISFHPTNPGGTAVTLWDGSVLRGQLAPGSLGFKIEPGPALSIATAHIVGIARAQVDPPDDVMARVDKLIARLGAESYEDRQKATDELIKMGKCIVPLLRKHLADDDPEVRHRIEDIMTRLGAEPSEAAQPTSPLPGMPILVK